MALKGTEIRSDLVEEHKSVDVIDAVGLTADAIAETAIEIVVAVGEVIADIF